MNYTYEVTYFVRNEEIVLRTNSIDSALTAFFDGVCDDNHVCLVDGLTGEVLAIANSPDMANYATEEMSLMMFGWAVQHFPAEMAFTLFK